MKATLMAMRAPFVPVMMAYGLAFGPLSWMKKAPDCHVATSGAISVAAVRAGSLLSAPASPIAVLLAFIMALSLRVKPKRRPGRGRKNAGDSSGSPSKPIDKDRYPAYIEKIAGGSSNGRTADSGSAYLGSNPSPPANLFSSIPAG